MSFIITVFVNEGIVMASDSRITYHHNSVNDLGVQTTIAGIHSNNTTDKTFLCPNSCGISYCGDSSLFGKPINGFISDFIYEQIDINTTVTETAQKILDYFTSFEQKLNTQFILAGYQDIEEKKVQKVYFINVSKGDIEERSTQNQGATWAGETNTMTKIIHNTYIKEGNNYIPIPTSEIAWNFFTLQDAIDFARYAVETTINTMRFQLAIETVGGPIDILVIKPEESMWLSKKKLV